jgi:type I restriction enzyme S subunit
MKLPKGWKMKSIGDIAEIAGGIQKGPHREASANPVRYLTVAHVQRNRLLLDDPRFFEVTRAELERWRLLKGDVLIIEGNGSADQIGRTAMFRGEIADCVHQNHVIRVRPSPDKVSGEYLNSLMNSPVGQAAVQLQSSTSSGLRTLSVGKIREMFFPLPPLPEQRKIADILTTWDEALTQLDALIEAQERRKKALMQQLLTGKKRFPGFKGKWKTVSLGDVLEPITRPTAKPQGKFLAAGIRSHGKGVFLKHDFIPANIALDELFELKTGDLVVNITFAWEGAAAIVPPEADGALVSHRFPAFGFREGKAARSFFRHYIRTHRFVFDCGLASPGGAGRNRVLSKSAFLDIELPLPPNEEQQKIGDILDTADQQLTLLRTQRTALNQQKRGLMQRLLTGKLRVNS